MWKRKQYFYKNIKRERKKKREKRNLKQEVEKREVEKFTHQGSSVFPFTWKNTYTVYNSNPLRWFENVVNIFVSEQTC